jgi:hypothetical protein
MPKPEITKGGVKRPGKSLETGVLNIPQTFKTLTRTGTGGSPEKAERGAIEGEGEGVREEPPNALRSTLAPPDKNCCCCNLYISVRNLVPLGGFVCFIYREIGT